MSETTVSIHSAAQVASRRGVRLPRDRTGGPADTTFLSLLLGGPGQPASPPAHDARVGVGTAGRANGDLSPPYPEPARVGQRERRFPRVDSAGGRAHGAHLPTADAPSAERSASSSLTNGHRAGVDGGQRLPIAGNRLPGAAPGRSAAAPIDEETGLPLWWLSRGRLPALSVAGACAGGGGYAVADQPADSHRCGPAGAAISLGRAVSESGRAELARAAHDRGGGGGAPYTPLVTRTLAAHATSVYGHLTGGSMAPPPGVEGRPLEVRGPSVSTRDTPPGVATETGQPARVAEGGGLLPGTAAQATKAGAGGQTQPLPTLDTLGKALAPEQGEGRVSAEASLESGAALAGLAPSASGACVEGPKSLSFSSMEGVAARALLDGGALVEQVAQRVVWQIGQGGSRAAIELDPPHLGRIDIHILVRGDDIGVSFVAAEPSVREALEGGIARLRESLGQHGLNLGGVDVGDGRSGDHASFASHSDVGATARTGATEANQPMGEGRARPPSDSVVDWYV